MFLYAGYRVSSTHANPLGTKTDAPFEVIWDIMRAWVKDHPGKPLVRPPPRSQLPTPDVPGTLRQGLQ